MYQCFFRIIGEFIAYRMEDMDWCGYEDEETGEWICSLIVVYDPATSSNLPKQRWHRATDKINQVNTACFITILTRSVHIYYNVSSKHLRSGVIDH